MSASQSKPSLQPSEVPLTGRSESDLATFPPPDIGGAEYFRYSRLEDGLPLLITTPNGRPVQDIRRQGSTYEEILGASKEGAQGVAAYSGGALLGVWPYSCESVKNDLISDGMSEQERPASSVNEISQNDHGDLAEQFVNISVQMRNARRWLLFRFESSSESQVKPRKVPYYVNGSRRSGALDDDADIRNLGTFQQAVEVFNKGAFSGLGFALGPDGTGNVWQGIDLDDLPARPHLEHIKEELPGYTERSVSGRGVHAIGYGREFAALSPNQTGIEAYSRGRYFVVTGDCAGLADPCDLSGFVESVLRPAHARGAKSEFVTPDRYSETIDPRTQVELKSALCFVNSDDREQWINMGMALKPLGSVGRGLWLEWSQTSEKFDPADAARTWDSLKPERTGYRAVFAEAQRGGWVNPLSNLATNGGMSGSPQLTYDQEAFSGSSLDEYVVDLAETIDPRSEHPHVIDRLVPQGEVTLLAGHGGAGKSYIALLMGVHVATGQKFGAQATQRKKVLFFSAEDDKAELLRRTARICSSLGIYQSQLKDSLYLMDVSEIDATLFRVSDTVPLHTTQVITLLAEFVKEHEIGLTVIDNASEVFDGNEIIRVHVRAFIRALRKIARPAGAVILLVHVNKLAANSRGGATEDYSGSTAWHNSARSRLSLETNDAQQTTLSHMKANKGPKAEPIQIEWFSGTPLVVGSEGSPEITEIKKNLEQDFLRRVQQEKDALVTLIQDFDQRGEIVTDSIRGGYTTFKTLKNEAGFPTSVQTPDRLNGLIRDLEREKRIFRIEERRNGKTRGRFTCIPPSCEERRIEISDSLPEPTTQVND